MKKLLLIGDSLTYGFLPPFGMLASAPGDTLRDLSPSDWSITIDGVPGARLSEICLNLQAQLASASFDLIVLLGGTNNLGGLNSAEMWSELHEMYKIVEKCGETQLLALTIPESVFNRPGIDDEYVKCRVEVNEKIKQFAQENEFAFLLDLEKLIPYSEDKFSDSLHFNRAGYEEIGLLLHEKIQQIWPPQTKKKKKKKKKKR